jgi:hypothetical protein
MQAPQDLQDLGHASDDGNDFYMDDAAAELEGDAGVLEEDTAAAAHPTPNMPVHNATLVNGTVPWLRSLILQGNTFVISMGKSLMVLANINISTAMLGRLPELVSAVKEYIYNLASSHASISPDACQHTI